MKRTVFYLFAVLVGWSYRAAGQSVSTGVLYSNFGPGETFDTDPTHGWGINGFLGPNILQQGIAEKFIPATTDTFTSAQLALEFITPGSVLVSLHTDADGRPGAILEQIAVPGLTTGPTVRSAASVVRPLLQAGSTYWLSVVAGGPGLLAGWIWNSIGDVSTLENCAATFDGIAAGPWFPGCFIAPGPNGIRSAFQINGRAQRDFAFSALQAGVEVRTTRARSEAEGRFTLGDASDGIDPSADDVSFQIGSFSGTIPNGSFQVDPFTGLFRFDGLVAGARVEAEIAPVAAAPRTFTFEIEVKNVDVAAGANAVTVQLAIGNDTGTTTAPVESKAR